MNPTQLIQLGCIGPLLTLSVLPGVTHAIAAQHKPVRRLTLAAGHGAFWAHPCSVVGQYMGILDPHFRGFKAL